MFRLVYFDGISIRDAWFDKDVDQLKFSLANLRFKILEWKKYECKEDARPLNTFTI